MSAYDSMPRGELLRALEAISKNWLAHDGCWFLVAEERLGLDARAWQLFAAAEGRRGPPGDGNSLIRAGREVGSGRARTEPGSMTVAVALDTLTPGRRGLR